MHLMYFTEQPMSAYPAKEADRLGYSIPIFPNHYFDPKEGSRLYNERLQEYILAEEVGFDGIMLNEHYNGPFCMQAKVNIFATLLAGMPKRSRLSRTRPAMSGRQDASREEAELQQGTGLLVAHSRNSQGYSARFWNCLTGDLAKDICPSEDFSFRLKIAFHKLAGRTDPVQE